MVLEVDQNSTGSFYDDLDTSGRRRGGGPKEADLQ